MQKEFSTHEYAARMEKATVFSAYFFAYGVTSDMVARMGLRAPKWKQLASAISNESGLKLKAPGSQATIDEIVKQLRMYEGAKSQAFEVRW